MSHLLIPSFLVFGFLEDLIPVQDWIDTLYNFVSDLSYIEQLVGLIVAAIIVVLGIISLVIKLSKLIIVVAILAGVWFLWTTGVFGG